MFQSVDEGLHEYQKALQCFKQMVDTFGLTNGVDNNKIRHPEDWAPWLPNQNPGALSSRDFNIVHAANLRIKGMEIALGFNPDEIRTAYAQAGLRVQ
jgi:hypothetical protein